MDEEGKMKGCNIGIMKKEIDEGRKMKEWWSVDERRKLRYVKLSEDGMKKWYDIIDKKEMLVMVILGFGKEIGIFNVRIRVGNEIRR